MTLGINLGTLSNDAALLASLAIILGTVFVVIEMKDNRRLVEATHRQADASTQQLKQNYELATVDLVSRMYDFANSMEVQKSWRTVMDERITSYEDYEKLPEEKQLAFHQIASLFESLGLLVEKGYVKEELVDDMFATMLAWDRLEPFVKGMRARYKTEDYYVWMESLYDRLKKRSAAAG